MVSSNESTTSSRVMCLSSTPSLSQKKINFLVRVSKLDPRPLALFIAVKKSQCQTPRSRPKIESSKPYRAIYMQAISFWKWGSLVRRKNGPGSKVESTTRCNCLLYRKLFIRCRSRVYRQRVVGFFLYNRALFSLILYLKMTS